MANNIIKDIEDKIQEAVKQAAENSQQTKDINNGQSETNNNDFINWLEKDIEQTKTDDTGYINWLEYNAEQNGTDVTKTTKNSNKSTTTTTSNKLITDQKAMAANYTNYMNKVTDMLVNDGPIYDVWIKFQIGLTNPIVFDSRSQNKSENLIASLEMTKSCAGVANDFTLTIQYDPFDMGQKSEETDIVEQLDEFIAQAMATDFTDSNKSLRGRLQYGYNSTSDTNLVSPNYEYYITGATSNIRYNSGLATYTFTGVSLLSADCDNTQSFPSHDDWDLFDVILGILYKYYGDPDNPPNHVSGVVPDDNPYHYLIDIPDDLYVDGLKAGDFRCEACSGMTAWQYCMKLLDDNPLTKSQYDSGEYDGILEQLTYTERPKYLMYLEDIEGQHIIRIRHVTPTIVIEDNNVVSVEINDENALKIDYNITWGLQNKNNIVVEWSPQIDLQLYLIRNAKYRAGNYELLTNKRIPNYR